ncbi:MAG: 16S rRNA (guanine(966)-N(2))-methyltransferase RsmD [Coriobacteriia bacterium]|nr:16S rRNA (guanine(966)-N(2))-methyltransferase RsmD [Coriobacteriia bacterium]
MRIIAGQLRGKVIQAPKGDGTRPTIDRVRESLFSSLYSSFGGFDDIHVLDAFAGSGAMGLEAVSRGAASAVFFEMDPAAAKVVERNISDCRLGAPQCTVRRADVLASPPVRPRHPFNLVLLDPPYAMDPALVFGLMDRLAQSGALAPDALVCYEHATATDLDEFAAQAQVAWELNSKRKYGKTTVNVYRREQ